MLIEVNDTLARGLIASGLATEVRQPEQEPASSWPRVLTVQTPWGIPVRFNAAAPINAAWYPGMAVSIVGQGGVLDDPSNGAKIGQPIRSEAGFPLVYATAGATYVGTPSVAIGDQVFNSDAEAIDYLARVRADESSKGNAPPRDFVPRPSPDSRTITPETLAEWRSLIDDDAARGRWLNNHPGVDRLLLNSGLMSHEESSRYANAAQGYR